MIHLLSQKQLKNGLIDKIVHRNSTLLTIYNIFWFWVLEWAPQKLIQDDLGPNLPHLLLLHT